MTSHHPIQDRLAPRLPGDGRPRISVANPKRVRLDPSSRTATTEGPASLFRRWARILPKLPRIPVAPRFA